MGRFYRTATVIVLALLVLSALVVAAGAALTKRRTEMLPADKSVVPWLPSTVPERADGDNRVLVASDGQSTSTVAFSLMLSTEEDKPYTSFNFYLADPKHPSDLVDLRGFSEVSFRARCTPKNILVFAIYTYVEGVTELERPETYRVSLAFAPCETSYNKVSFDLASLDSADWWLERYGLQYTDRTADLARVHGFAINNSLQSPRGVLSQVEIKDLALITDNHHFLIGSIVLALLAWIAAAYFLVKRYIREQLQAANEKFETNRPWVAYQKLSIKQTADDLETRLLRYVAVEYANPDVSIEQAATTLNTTRSKINKILKAELGLTFTSYINKLRLTEASRLLREDPSLSVKQVALGVGFANVTYFNALFKKEYGCTPKMFRQGGPKAETENPP